MAGAAWRMRRAANSHIAVVGAGMLRATWWCVSMRPVGVEGSHDTEAACCWYSRESEVFFSHSTRSIPCVILPPHLLSPAIKLTKGNIKLNYARSVVRQRASVGNATGATGRQIFNGRLFPLIHRRAHARAACFALIVIKRIAINPGWWDKTWARNSACGYRRDATRRWCRAYRHRSHFRHAARAHRISLILRITLAIVRRIEQGNEYMCVLNIMKNCGHSSPR